MNTKLLSIAAATLSVLTATVVLARPLDEIMSRESRARDEMRRSAAPSAAKVVKSPKATAPYALTGDQKAGTEERERRPATSHRPPPLGR